MIDKGLLARWPIGAIREIEAERAWYRQAFA
jgi:hypothetical protein